MTYNQQRAFTAALKDHTPTTAARIGNGIDQVLGGTWSASGFKQSTTWALMTEDEKIEVSKLLNKWLYEANGGAGCDTQKALRAYFKPEHQNCSIIMPSKLLV